MPAVTNRMTTVRMSVATFEFMPATPSLPRMAVSPAKKAEPSANSSQLEASGFMAWPSRALRCASAQRRLRGLLPAPCARRQAEVALERAVERGLRFVAARVGDRLHRQVARLHAL